MRSFLATASHVYETIKLPWWMAVKRIFKRVPNFFLLPCSFWEISNYLLPRVIVQNYILKECLISKDLQIINYKKTDTALIDVCLSCTAENFKMNCIALGIWSLPITSPYNHLKKQGSNFTSLVALHFPPEYDVMCYYLIFHVPNFLTAFIN